MPRLRTVTLRLFKGAVETVAIDVLGRLGIFWPWASRLLDRLDVALQRDSAGA